MRILSSFFYKMTTKTDESHDYLLDTDHKWKEFRSVSYGTAEPPKENTENPLTEMYKANIRQKRAQDELNSFGSSSSTEPSVLSTVIGVIPDLLAGVSGAGGANCSSVAESLYHQLSNITVTSARIYVPLNNNQSKKVHSIIGSMFLSRTGLYSPLLANDTGIVRNETVLKNVEIRINKTQAMTIRDQLCPLNVTLEQDCFNNPDVVRSFIAQVSSPSVLSEVVCDELPSSIEVITDRGSLYSGKHLKNCQYYNAPVVLSRVEPTAVGPIHISPTLRINKSKYKPVNVAIVSDGVNSTKLLPIPGITVTLTKCFIQYGDMVGNFCKNEELNTGSVSCRENKDNKLRECVDGSLVSYRLGQLVPGSMVVDLRASFYQKTGNKIMVRQLSESNILASINTVLELSSNTRPYYIYIIMPPEQTTSCFFYTPAVERAVHQARKEGIKIFVQVPNLSGDRFPSGVREVISIEEALEVESSFEFTIPTEVVTTHVVTTHITPTDEAHKFGSLWWVVLGIFLISVAAFIIVFIMRIRKHEYRRLVSSIELQSFEVVNSLISDEDVEIVLSKSDESDVADSSAEDSCSLGKQGLLPRSFSFCAGDKVASLGYRSLSLDQMIFSGELDLGVMGSDLEKIGGADNFNYSGAVTRKYSGQSDIGAASEQSNYRLTGWKLEEQERRQRWNAALDNFGGDSRHKLELYDPDLGK
ncbi:MULTISPECIES: hypothetical protein [Candidatus Ichthyocystis]|uniref:Putative membrane protein n=1 Tax=Candidatus Ichthyocystis hellenicum TaxID=1561003 RepID=A0A0S4M3H4_9BURK|nr:MULTISPECIES: hypothetical protein [Ichthyocystis]CUT18323.1 putative membrane protein [Candidatus Ichthyocystis hellenicum]